VDPKGNAKRKTAKEVETKRKASPYSTRPNSTINGLIPQEHLDFYLTIYRRMEALKKRVSAAREDEKFLRRKLVEIDGLSKARFLPEVSPARAIFEYQKKHNRGTAPKSGCPHHGDRKGAWSIGTDHISVEKGREADYT
jgi:hypothetical protein